MTVPTTSAHFQRVRAFMVKAKQDVPTTPTCPSESVRLLRARLVLEEAIELCEAMGIDLSVQTDEGVTHIDSVRAIDMTFGKRKVDVAAVAQECADVSVVNIGTMIAFGVADDPVIAEVDRANLDKFGPGHSYREDGKLIKPAGHKKPDIAGVLAVCYPDAESDSKTDAPVETTAVKVVCAAKKHVTMSAVRTKGAVGGKARYTFTVTPDVIAVAPGGYGSKEDAQTVREEYRRNLEGRGYAVTVE